MPVISMPSWIRRLCPTDEHVNVCRRKALSLAPLEMARVGLGEDPRLRPTSARVAAGIQQIRTPDRGQRFGRNGSRFQRPRRTFTYVPALDVMADSDKIEIEINRKIASYSKTDLLKDAYGSAFRRGVFDMRSFPFDSNVAGVEGHANILDNLLGR